MITKDDELDHNENVIGNERKYSTASEGDLTIALLSHQKVMKAQTKTDISANADCVNEKERATFQTQTFGEEQNDSRNGASQISEERSVKKEEGRNISTQSLTGSAQISLQLTLDNVKVELKEQKRYSINSFQKSANLHKDDKKERTGWQRYLGIIFSITSSMVFALALLIVKMMNYDPYSISFWRFIGNLIPATIIVFYCRVLKKTDIFGSIWPPAAKGNIKSCCFLFLRCLGGSTGVVLYFSSVRFISMADASVIASSTPVFVAIASHFFLGEKLGLVPIFCGIFTFAGVAIISRPPMLTGQDFDTNTLIGAGLALGCMCCATSAYLVLRYLRQMHFSLITLAFAAWGCVQSSALAVTISEFKIPENMNDWLLTGAVAGLSFIGQTCLTLSLKYEQASVVSLCRMCDILFAYLWQFMFMGTIPDLFSLVGGIIVVIGVVIAALRKFVNELPEDSQLKKNLWFLLV